MMKNKIIIISFLFFLLFINANKLEAIVYDCKKEDENKLLELANLIDVTFYEEEGNLNLMVNNIYDNFIVIDRNTQIGYKGYDTENIIIYNIDRTKEINLSVISNMSNCYNKVIRTIKKEVPKYNPYYDTSICSGMNGYPLCDKYYPHGYTEEQFNSIVKSAKVNYDKIYYNKTSLTNAENILNFLSENYLLITIPTIILGTGGIVLLKLKENQRLKL